MSPRSLRKIFNSCKTDKSLSKRLTSQRDRERIYNYKFSKVNVLRKGKAGTSGVRPSGFYKGRDKREVGLDAGRNLFQVWSS